MGVVEAHDIGPCRRWKHDFDENPGEGRCGEQIAQPTDWLARLVSNAATSRVSQRLVSEVQTLPFRLCRQRESNPGLHERRLK